MEFIDRSTHYDDGSRDYRCVSGIYLVTAYEHTDEITGTEGLYYYAYVAVEPLKDDGDPGHVNNIRVGQPPFRTFKDAAKECESHSAPTPKEQQT